MKAHFVTFLSPGTFVCEQSEKPIESWDVKLAIKMAKKITERHGATPFGFRFSTRERTEKDLDSKVTKTSGIYYLNGRVLTLKEVKARNDSRDKILISNMEINDIEKIVEKKPDAPGWMWCFGLDKKDVVLEEEFIPKKVTA